MSDYIRENPWCLTLSEDMMDERDFKAEDAIELDMKVKLPKSFSLWQWVYSTNYQNWWGSCTSNATSHWVQVVNVRDGWVLPTKNNIITPNWRNLWTNMGHDLKDKNDSWDYIEKALNTALKFWIKTEEWWIAKFDWYSYDSWSCNNESIEKIKRYLYNWNPVDRCLRGNQTTWNELTAGQLKTFIPAWNRTWGHAICCVWWDEWWLWFLNSWKTNDWKNLKSRFYVSYKFLLDSGTMFNWRYRPIYKKEQAKADPAYLKKKNSALIILKALKSMYPDENADTKKAIEQLSKEFRKSYPEINKELPVNW